MSDFLTSVLIDTVYEEGIVKIIYDMTKQMTEQELNDKLMEHVENYKKSHYNTEGKLVLRTVDFWRELSTKDLCDDFLRHFQDSLYWDLIGSCNRSLSIDTIEEFEDKINIKNLTQNSCLTNEMFLIHQDKLDRMYIPCATMGEDYLIENQDKYKFGWCSISDNCHDFSYNFFEKCKDKLYWWRISRWMKNMDEEFYRLFHDKLYWCEIIEYNEVSDEILIKYKESIKPKQFLKNYNYTKTKRINMIGTREQYTYDRLNKIINLEKIETKETDEYHERTHACLFRG
jgi:hypothetical protein